MMDRRIEGAAMECIESDWKLFRTLIPVWRERYVEKQLAKIKGKLVQEEAPSDIFWSVYGIMKKQAKVLTDSFDNVSRSSMHVYLLTMYSYKIITLDDLKDFSGELRMWAGSAFR